MNRWLALLLATVGGAISAWFGTMMFFGLVVGVLWLFVFGDDPWPDWILNDLEIGLILSVL